MMNILLSTLIALSALKTVFASGSISQANGNSRTSFYGNANINKANIPGFTILAKTLLGTGEKFLAQPLVYGKFVTLLSMSNTLYQLDVNTGSILKKRQLGKPFNIVRDLPDCGGTDPAQSAHGGQATPVIWRGNLYVLVKTYKPGTSSGLSNSIYVLHGLDFTTWTEIPGFPVTISGSYKGIVFNPSIHQQRSGLLVQDDKLFFSFASYCDEFVYRGWIFSYDPSSGNHLCTFAPEIGSGQRGAGIWQSGMGLSASDAGSFYGVTGNGFGNNLTPTPGSKAASFPLSNSVVRFSTTTCQPVDFFSPADNADLDQQGLDLGVGAFTLLPPAEFGNAAHPKIGVTLSKDNKIWVLDIKNLGGYQQGPGGKDKIVQIMTYVGNEARSTPAVCPIDKTVYVSANEAPLQAFEYDATTGLFTAVGQSNFDLQFNTGTPAVSSVGSTPGTAAVWVNDTPFVRAFDAIPKNGVLHQLLVVNVGSTCKFTSPTFSAGKVYVATCDGHLVILG